jgi:hypothetical protein
VKCRVIAIRNVTGRTGVPPITPGERLSLQLFECGNYDLLAPYLVDESTREAHPAGAVAAHKALSHNTHIGVLQDFPGASGVANYQSRFFCAVTGHNNSQDRYVKQSGLNRLHHKGRCEMFADAVGTPGVAFGTRSSGAAVRDFYRKGRSTPAYSNCRHVEQSARALAAGVLSRPKPAMPFPSQFAREMPLKRVADWIPAMGVYQWPSQFLLERRGSTMQILLRVRYSNDGSVVCGSVISLRSLASKDLERTSEGTSE